MEGAPFGVSAEAFLAERGVVAEPLVVTPEPARRRRAGGVRRAAPLDLDARAGGGGSVDDTPVGAALADAPAGDDPGGHGPGGELPGRFQGPAASRSVGAARPTRGERNWPTRQEREDRQRERDQARAQDIAADPVGVARQICLDQLGFAPRTGHELAKVLAARGIPDDAATEVLERFAEVGMIDDALFASMWVSSRHRSKGLAGRALSQELRRKGVDDAMVRAAVEELDPEQEAETARTLVRRRLATTRGLPTEARIRRLAGMLARKGYGAGTAFRVVKDELAREGADPPDVPFDVLASLED